MSIEAHDMRTLEDMEAGKPSFGDTVVVKWEALSVANAGDIGKVVEFDDRGGRTVKVTLRSGGSLWFRPEDIYVI